MSGDLTKGKDFDPFLEAVKREWLMYEFLVTAKSFLQAGRLPYLVLTAAGSSREVVTEAALVKEANDGAIGAFKDAALVFLAIKEIIVGYPDSFSFQDKEDYTNIGLGFEAVTKALGRKKGWRFWRKIVPHENLVELGAWLIIQTIESGFVNADQIPMERRAAFIQTFLGLKEIEMPVSCSIRPAGT